MDIRMITLRSLVRSDTAIASISSEECHMIAAILDAVGRNWFLRLFIPKKYREKSLAMRMIAATLGRTPEEREPSMQEAIRMQIEAGRK